MRRLIGRWVAILAVVTGLGMGATALPAAAATPSVTSTVSVPGHTHGGYQPDADWWI
jgi:hypothetical protein